MSASQDDIIHVRQFKNIDTLSISKCLSSTQKGFHYILKYTFPGDKEESSLDIHEELFIGTEFLNDFNSLNSVSFFNIDINNLNKSIFRQLNKLELRFIGVEKLDSNLTKYLSNFIKYLIVLKELLIKI